MTNLKYIALAVAIACVMMWLQYHPILSFLALVVFGGYLVTLLLSAFGIGMSTRKLVPNIAIAVFIVLWECLLQFNLIYGWTDRLAIKIETKKYESCKKSGIPFDGNRLAVCDVNDKWWRYDFTEAIVYDSSGQIMREHRSHSPAWINAALTLGPPFSSGEFSARHLSDDFYLVTFYYTSDDELISECRNIHEQCVLLKKQGQ